MSVADIHHAIATRVSELPALSKVPKKEKVPRRSYSLKRRAKSPGE
jgi:hypothetical protein